MVTACVNLLINCIHFFLWKAVIITTAMIIIMMMTMTGIIIPMLIASALALALKISVRLIIINNNQFVSVLVPAIPSTMTVNEPLLAVTM